VEPSFEEVKRKNTARIFSRQRVHQNTPQEVELASLAQINSFQGHLARMLVMQ
jgi:hypothetical protein